MAHVAKGSCVCLCVSVCVCVRICVCDCSHPVLHHLLMLLPVVSNERCVKSYRYACPCPRTHTHTHTHTHTLPHPTPTHRQMTLMKTIQDLLIALTPVQHPMPNVSPLWWLQ